VKKVVIPFLVTAVIILAMFLLFENIEHYFTTLLKESGNQKLIFSLVSFLVLTSDIVLPVPSSIVMYSNGFVLGAIQGMALSFLSVMIGTLFGYYLGRFTSLGLKAKEDRKTELFLNKYGGAAILVSRAIPILSESICIVCGYNKMNLKFYLLLNLLGYIPVCILYAYFGSIGCDKDSFLITFACSVLISALFLFIGRKYLKGI
jgi:uncharacterized membrane protein YdjX (TVP38/TMEM64 family)